MKLATFTLGVLLPLFCIALPEKVISTDDLSHGAVALDGLWAFDWQELHTDMNAPMQDGLKLPGLWHKQGPYQAKGFASLRLVVVLPERAKYYLRIPDVPSAVSVWVNGVQLYQRGTVAKQAHFEQPEFGPEVISLPPNDRYNIIMHISNFHHKDGGVWHDLLIANAQHRSELHQKNTIIEAMIFSILMLTSIYILVNNIFRHSHVSHLLFAAFIWAVALRSVLIGERIAYDFIDDVSWLSWQRLEYILLFVALPLFVYFFQRLFTIKSSIFPHIIALSSVILIACTLFYPADVFSHFGHINQLLILLSVLYCSFVMAVLVKKKVKYSLLFSVSFFGTLVFITHDYLYTNLWIQSRPMIQYGMMFFVAMQLYILWLHRKDEDKLIMFVKSSIDYKVRDLNANKLAVKSQDPFKVSHLITTIRPYCHVLNLSIALKDEDALLTVDKEYLQSIILILARMANANGIAGDLKINIKSEVASFKLTLDGPMVNNQLAEDSMNSVHYLLNEMEQVIHIDQLLSMTVLEFTIPVFNALGDKPNKQAQVYSGNQLATSILYSNDENGIINKSLKEYYYLIKTCISHDSIMKNRPALIIWKIKNWTAYSIEDMKTVISDFPALPVLLIIDQHQKHQLAQCIRMGITDYIITPVLPEELILKVQRVQQLKGPKLTTIEVGTDIREVAVNLIRNSISLWQKYSNKSKVELAEGSGLWRVYVDGSTAKTRTLDKYLSLQALPKNPRWETVARTANYVLEECELTDKDRNEFVKKLALFNQLLPI